MIDWEQFFDDIGVVALASWLIVHTVDVFVNRRTGDGKRVGPVSTDNRADAAENEHLQRSPIPSTVAAPHNA